MRVISRPSTHRGAISSPVAIIACSASPVASAAPSLELAVSGFFSEINFEDDDDDSLRYCFKGQIALSPAEPCVQLGDLKERLSS